ncbi:MAG: sulfotransferase family 2 domain-containing protein [Lentisphaerae bacterium]|nr:sulfotransferase family 2 domain-containing protein [Lentisphaerota bacterium]
MTSLDSSCRDISPLLQADRMREICVHIHVPKSAGSMLNSILLRNLDGRLGRDGPLASYLKYSQEDMRRLFFLYPFRCFTGHVYSLQALPLDTHPNTKAFSLVRDPVEKTVSSYYYIRQRGITLDTHPARRLSIAELVRRVKDEERHDPFVLDCSQTAWITGQGMGTLDTVDRFLENGTYHCFPTARFDEACVVLELLFPDAFRNCAYAQRVNVSQKEPVDETTLSLIRSLRWMEEDTELVRLADKHLTRQIERLFPVPGAFQSALDAFRERCNALAERTRAPECCPPSLLRRLVWWVTHDVGKR